MKMKTLGLLPVAMSSLAIAMTATYAHAGDGVAELLLKKGVISAAEYKQLKKESDSAAAKKAAAPATPNVSFSKGFVISSDDGDSSVQIGTLMQLDAAGYNDSGSIDNAAGTEMRRGRLNLRGKFMKDWQYKFELEMFGSSGAQVTDTYVRYNGFKPFESTKPLALTVGHFKIPFSLEQQMSISTVSLMEHSLPNAMLNSRAPGVMLSTSGSHWSAAAMGYGEQLYSNTSSPKQDEGGGVSTRITWAPLLDKNSALHLGFSAQYNKPTQSDGGATIAFSSRPESHMTSTKLISTGTISGDVSGTKLFGAELAGSYGPLTLQSEYIRTEVARDTGADPTFAGWYVQGAWMLTGEHRGYNTASGIFKGIHPAHPVSVNGDSGTGAWELTARYSTLDLNDAGITGGRERDTTLGIGWYANNYVRICGEWVHVYAIDGGTYDGDSLNTLQMRFQLAY